jgi:hypothetical protein
MGYWGVKSYENDEADEALDRGFERIHGDAYEALMDDRNPLTPEQIQAKLGNLATLDASVAYLVEEVGAISEDWEEEDRLGFVGVIVRHAELGVPIPRVWQAQALAWLRDESIDWEEATLRKLRSQKEIDLLEAATVQPEG